MVAYPPVSAFVQTTQKLTEEVIATKIDCDTASADSKDDEDADNVAFATTVRCSNWAYSFHEPRLSGGEVEKD